MSKSPTDIRIDQLRNELREVKAEVKAYKDAYSHLRTAFIEIMTTIKDAYGHKMHYKDKESMVKVINEVKAL